MTLHLTLLRLHSRQACFALGFLAAVSSLVSGGGGAGDMVGQGIFGSKTAVKGEACFFRLLVYVSCFLVSPSSGLGVIAILKDRVGYLSVICLVLFV